MKYWLVQTLFMATKAIVWASMAEGRLFFARKRGIRAALRDSCGRKARDSMPSPRAGLDETDDGIERAV